MPENSGRPAPLDRPCRSVPCWFHATPDHPRKRLGRGTGDCATRPEMLAFAGKTIPGACVASLLIRDLDAVLHMRLKASAAAHRRSLEEEARALLRTAVARQEAPARENLVTLARRLFGPRCSNAWSRSWTRPARLLRGRTMIRPETHDPPRHQCNFGMVKAEPDAEVTAYLEGLAPIRCLPQQSASRKFVTALPNAGRTRRDELIVRIDSLFAIRFCDSTVHAPRSMVKFVTPASLPASQ